MSLFHHGVSFAISSTLGLLVLNGIASAEGLRTVAITGQPAPGTPSGVNFSTIFDSAVLNGAGQTAFRAHLAGSGVNLTNDEGIWSEGSGNLALVARKGSQAPGTPSGVNFSIFVSDQTLLNAAGQVAFRARLTGTGVMFGTNDFGIWSQASGNLELVARIGDQAPGTPNGVTYLTLIGPPVLNSAGQTAFTATLTGNGVNVHNDEGIWLGGSGNLVLVVRQGNPAPDTPNDVYYGSLGLPVLNAAGQIAFSAYLTGTGVPFTNSQGIWSGSSGNLELVARSGIQAPGTPAGVQYLGFQAREPVINGVGQTAFNATLFGGGVDATNDSGIWSEGSGNLALVVREGSHAPGTPSGVNFGDFFGSPVLNGAGQTAFSASLRGSGVDETNDEGIWLERSGSLELVARSGSPAPGTPSDVNFDSFDKLVLNAAGQIAFQARVTGSGVDLTNNEGIWASDATGTLRLIARRGDPLEGAPSDRAIISLSFVVGSSCISPECTGNEDGRPSEFNDLGQVAFSAFFGDLGGVFVSNLVANDDILPGDFNGDLSVDAADYVVWRKTEPNNQAGYYTWRTNFGRTSGNSASTSQLRVVPESASLLLLGLGALGFYVLETRHRHDFSCSGGGQKFRLVYFRTVAIVTP